MTVEISSLINQYIELLKEAGWRGIEVRKKIKINPPAGPKFPA
jgi:hypothetical protein